MSSHVQNLCALLVSVMVVVDLMENLQHVKAGDASLALTKIYNTASCSSDANIVHYRYHVDDNCVTTILLALILIQARSVGRTPQHAMMEINIHYQLIFLKLGGGLFMILKLVIIVILMVIRLLRLISSKLVNVFIFL
ncbi:predicted protein [Naegleria gruberi]|uniref:Predicted protein n=1 Tax=Naegleria gruberi TaxID=5762 RepID=D2V9E6_NAEGR|nr:uncharacterized protein NAEGRDRAFT_65414 [Naegleria gruberi]EFC46576.1 predicted protein [Naegleria gruberi]|eukprot:XP_002679320.1 predicted protein [Naegleria gruberi strain NEG-M]